MSTQREADRRRLAMANTARGTCGVCHGALVGAWIARPGQPAVHLRCASVLMARALRGAQSMAHGAQRIERGAR